MSNLVPVTFRCEGDSKSFYLMGLAELIEERLKYDR